MTAARTREFLITLAWAVGTLVVWPTWYALSQKAPRPLVDWVNPPQYVIGGTPVLGVQALLAAIVLSASGFVFGLLGLWVMRRFGAPRLIWVVASAASIYVATSRAIFWSNCGNSGLAYLAVYFMMPALSLSVGAWLGSTIHSVYLTSASSRAPGAVL